MAPKKLLFHNNFITFRSFCQSSSSGKNLTDGQKKLRWLDVSVVKRNGRAFEADKELLPPRSAIYFPKIQCSTLSGVDKIYPNDANAKVKLITFSFKEYGNGLVKTWYQPFSNHFKDAQYNGQVKPIKLLMIEYSLLSIAKQVFISGMKPNVPSDQHDNVGFVFGGVKVRSLKLSVNYVL